MNRIAAILGAAAALVAGAAQAQAERFLRFAPESPLAERVRAACNNSNTKPVTGIESGREP